MANPEAILSSDNCIRPVLSVSSSKRGSQRPNPAVVEKHLARQEQWTFIRRGLRDFWAEWISPSFQNEWLGEVLAAVYNIVAIIVLSLVLLRHHNKPLSGWHTRITINTFISILSTSLRLSLAWIVTQVLGQQKWLHFSQGSGAPLIDLQLYDGASRGPWGAIKLIFGCRSILAFWGACLAIVVLFIDPQYDVPPKEFEGIVQLGDSSLQQGVVSGTVQNPLQVHPTCGSGNCESDYFGSVAFCASCQSGMGFHNNSILISPSNVTWQITDDIYTQVKIVYSDYPLIAGFKRPIFGFAKPNDLQLSTTPSAGSLSFTECALTFCAKKYKLNVTQGIVQISTLNRSILGTENLEHPNISDPYFEHYTVSAQTRQEILDYFRLPLNYTSSDLYFNLGGRKNVTGMMQDLASSMSIALLRETGPSTVPVYGTTYTVDTIIYVRWGWLALPISLVLATFITLIVIVQRSYLHQDTNLWKSSVLAPLYTKIEGSCTEPPHGPGSDSVGWLGSILEMEHVAHTQMATLTQDARGRWIFKIGHAVERWQRPATQLHRQTPMITARRLRRAAGRKKSSSQAQPEIVV